MEQLQQGDKVLAGKKVLIVDDDIRNIFALTSVLERHQMAIASAETGRQAIEILQSELDIDIVLMQRALGSGADEPPVEIAYSRTT